MKIVPDTSVIIDGRITSLIESGEYRGAEVIIPEALIAELEFQANRGRETGFSGLEELRKLGELTGLGIIQLTFSGQRPGLDQVKLAGGGEIDAMIRQVAQDCEALLVTSDRVQSLTGKAKGLDVIYLAPERAEFKPLTIEEFFTSDTMSVHLKDGVHPMAKKGSIKDIRLVKIRDIPLTEHELRGMVRELMERAKRDPDSFLEMEYDGGTVLQIGNIRIAIAMPPFSSGIEITAVRPVAYVSLEDYRLSEELKQRLVIQQRGVLIAGPPGAGKSTFAAGVAGFLQSCNKIVKTMESPRDLVVDKTITQYSPLEGSMEKTADLLLLVRPDYTIYDEVRKTRDFKVFADMRLAGVGMVGVVHGNRPVDAIQRLIGRVELGIIPQVVDTVIFIDKGEVSSVHDIAFTVKVPHGMTESDLARPVITITDFETGNVEYEIYTYGEQVVVMPTSAAAKVSSPAWDLAARKIRDDVQRRINGPVRVQLNSDDRATVLVNKNEIPALLGKGGSNIEKLEDRLGIHIDVRPIGPDKEQDVAGELTSPKITQTKRHIILTAAGMAGNEMEVMLGNEHLFTATVGRKGDIRITKDSDIGQRILEALQKNKPINFNLL